MARKEKALEILKNGGYFSRNLEPYYKGGMKYQIRLRDKNHHVVKGFGFKTFHELCDAGEIANHWIIGGNGQTYHAKEA